MQTNLKNIVLRREAGGGEERDVQHNHFYVN